MAKCYTVILVKCPEKFVIVSTITSSLKQVKFDSEKCPDLMPAVHGDPHYTEYSFRNYVTPRQCIGCDECVREICEELCARTNRGKTLCPYCKTEYRLIRRILPDQQRY